MSKLSDALESKDYLRARYAVNNISSKRILDIHERHDDVSLFEKFVHDVHDLILQFEKIEFPNIARFMEGEISKLIKLCADIVDIDNTLIMEQNRIGTIPMQLFYKEDVQVFRSNTERHNSPNYNRAYELSTELMTCFLTPESTAVIGHRGSTVLLYAAYFEDINLVNQIVRIGGIDLLFIEDSKQRSASKMLEKSLDEGRVHPTDLEWLEPYSLSFYVSGLDTIYEDEVVRDGQEDTGRSEFGALEVVNVGAVVDVAIDT